MNEDQKAKEYVQGTQWLFFMGSLCGVVIGGLGLWLNATFSHPAFQNVLIGFIWALVPLSILTFFVIRAQRKTYTKKDLAHFDDTNKGMWNFLNRHWWIYIVIFIFARAIGDVLANSLSAGATDIFISAFCGVFVGCSLILAFFALFQKGSILNTRTQK